MKNQLEDETIRALIVQRADEASEAALGGELDAVSIAILRKGETIFRYFAVAGNLEHSFSLLDAMIGGARQLLRSMMGYGPGGELPDMKPPKEPVG